MLNKLAALATIGSFVLALYTLHASMWLIFGAMLLLTAGLYGFAAVKSKPSNSRNSAVETIKTEKPVFVGRDITPQYLDGIIRGHTSLQAQKVVELYIGKWMKLVAPLEPVSKPHGRTLTDPGR